MNNFVGSQTEYKAESIDEGRHTDRAKGRIINEANKTCSSPRRWGAVEAWSQPGRLSPWQPTVQIVIDTHCWVPGQQAGLTTHSLGRAEPTGQGQHVKT